MPHIPPPHTPNPREAGGEPHLLLDMEETPRGPSQPGEQPGFSPPIMASYSAERLFVTKNSIQSGKNVQEEFLMAPPTDQGAVPVHSWLGYKGHLHQALSSPEHYIFLLWGRIDRRVSVCSGEGGKKCAKESLNFHFSY